MVKKKDGAQNRREAGQGMLEYLILVALIALASVAATRLLGQKISTKIRKANAYIENQVRIPGE